MKYYSIPKELEPFVQSVWSYESPVLLNTKEQGIVIPSGNCVLIWNYKGEYYHQLNDKRYFHPLYDLHLIGQTKTRINLLGDDPVSSIGVSFKPFGFYAIAGAALSSFTNQVVSISKINREHQTVLANFSGNINESIIELTNLLTERIAFVPDKRVVYLVKEIERTNGNILVKNLFSNVNGSQRYLNQIFKLQVGLTPKEYSSIVRFRELYNRFIRDRDIENKTELYDFFFDESHFIRSFKNILSIKPHSFMKNPNYFGNQFIKK